MMLKVFVYGTLLKGLERSALLQKYEFIGMAKTRPEFTMVSVYERFPGIIPGGKTPITGEVYLVDVPGIKLLDSIEGCIVGNKEESVYNRKIITLDSGEEALTYCFNADPEDYYTIHSGDWRKFLIWRESWRKI